MPPLQVAVSHSFLDFDFRLNTFDMTSRKQKRSVGISGKLSRSPGKQHVAPQNVLLKRRQAQRMPSLFDRPRHLTIQRL
jgi:hypothetical protein